MTGLGAYVKGSALTTGDGVCRIRGPAPVPAGERAAFVT